MTQQFWSKVIRLLKPGMTVAQVAKLMRRSESLVQQRLIQNGYQFRKVKKYQRPRWVDDVDWRRTNAEIGREFEMSREMVRRWRDRLGKPKVSKRSKKKRR